MENKMAKMTTEKSKITWYYAKNIATSVAEMALGMELKAKTKALTDEILAHELSILREQSGMTCSDEVIMQLLGRPTIVSIITGDEKETFRTTMDAVLPKTLWYVKGTSFDRSEWEEKLDQDLASLLNAVVDIKLASDSMIKELSEWLEFKTVKKACDTYPELKQIIHKHCGVVEQESEMPIVPLGDFINRHISGLKLLTSA